MVCKHKNSLAELRMKEKTNSNCQTLLNLLKYSVPEETHFQISLNMNSLLEMKSGNDFLTKISKGKINSYICILSQAIYVHFLI